MFLKNILSRPNHLIFSIYQAQSVQPAKNDFYLTVQNDKTYYDIELSDEEIRIMSKTSFKKYLESKINLKSTEEIMNSRKIKMDSIIRNLKPSKDGKLRMQTYLKS